MSRPWFTFTGLAVITLILAIGGSAALWGRPDGLLTAWQRMLAGNDQADTNGMRDAQEQVVHLNAENVLLRARLAQYASIRGEGGFPPERVVIARGRVVGRTARSGRRFLHLDVGTAAGVAVDQPACIGWSLAGMVTGIREGRCLVQELADSESRIPATILNGKENLAEGVLVGGGQPGWARLEFIEQREGLRIEPGYSVVTAGSDGRLPPGLVLGRIDNAVRGSGSDTWKLRVRLTADASSSESLLILKVPNTPPTNDGAPTTEQ
ncbi:MAG: rod shape-determining protein MreC [Planctomycetota bacterium]